MTTSGFKSDLDSRITGFLLSGAIHLAAGLALLYTSNLGVPVRGPTGGDRGDALVVELIPLDRVGRPQGAGTTEHHAPTRDKAPTPPTLSARQGPSDPAQAVHAAGAATADVSASSEEPGDARQMSDLPSSEVAAYRQRLESHLARYRVFPAGARSAGREGVVTVYFSMTREGRVLDAWVEASSGVSDLDAEALAAILRAQPLPGLPHSWPGRIDVSLPVTFRLG